MQLTVKDLLQCCLLEVRNGNGDRKIIVSDDNECNGFHGLFFGFSEIAEEDKGCYDDLLFDTEEREASKILILG